MYIKSYPGFPPYFVNVWCNIFAVYGISIQEGDHRTESETNSERIIDVACDT